MTKSLETIKLDNLGYINSGYSAHYKVDPLNGNIFNIGYNYLKQKLNLYHCDSEMKLILKR